MSTAQEAPRTTTPPVHVPAAQRLMSLDVFRDVTIASMMLVNNAGDFCMRAFAERCSRSLRV